jgi:drug/metabolite transporter (DMT)-like permease
MKQKQTIGGLAIIIAASLWAMDSAVIRPRLFDIDASIVVFLEHGFAFALMAVLLYLSRKELKKLDRKDWLTFGWIALFGGAIGTIAITKAFFTVFLEGVSSVSVVVLLQKLQPLFAIVLAWIILKERPKPSFYFWAGLALVGSYLTAFGFHLPDLSSQNPAIIVPLLAILAAFSFGSSTVMGKRVISKVSFQVATYIRFGMVTFIMLAVVLVSGKLTQVTEISSFQFGLIWIIVFTSGAAAIALYYFGLKRVLASQATILELAFPVVALVLDYTLHDTVLSSGQWIGGAVLVWAMTMVSLNK